MSSLFRFSQRRRTTEQPVPRWAIALLGGLAVALLPWAATLNLILPDRTLVNHWDIAWTGFDVGLACVLASAAVAAYRGSPRLPLLATAAGTALVCDAWFDVVTARRGTDVAVSLIGLAVEIPLALLCFAIAARTGPG